MTPESFLERVEADNRTALSRLGSSKALYAETAGELEESTVLAAAADAEHHAAVTYRGWADDEPVEVARAAWTEIADEEEVHYDRVLATIDGGHEPGEPPAIHRELRQLEDAVVRAGGFIGRTLAAERSKSQFTGYFVGQAAPDLASLFRELGDDLDGQLERGEAVLEAVCTTEAEWERAGEAADAAIQAAYEEYVATLESMGVNPKPVC